MLRNKRRAETLELQQGLPSNRSGPVPDLALEAAILQQNARTAAAKPLNYQMASSLARLTHAPSSRPFDPARPKPQQHDGKPAQATHPGGVPPNAAEASLTLSWPWRVCWSRLPQALRRLRRSDAVILIRIGTSGAGRVAARPMVHQRPGCVTLTTPPLGVLGGGWSGGDSPPAHTSPVPRPARRSLRPSR